MNMNGMAVFVAVAETGSMTAAGKRLNLPKATISRRLRAYEDALHTTLFRRSTRALSLTDTGQRHFQRVSGLVHDAEEALTEIREDQALPTGLIRISTSVMFGENFLAPAIWSLTKSYPGLRFDLVLGDELVDIVKEGVDFAIRLGEPEDSELIGRTLGSASQTLVATPECLQKRTLPKTVADLDGFPTIVAAARRNHWHFADGTVYRCSWRIAAGSINASLGACLQGLGICSVPERMARPYIDNGELVRVLEHYPLREVPIVLLYPRIRHQSAITRILLEALRGSMTQSLSVSEHPQQ
ncbi:DNA-binding transcriptional regulator, LysR family [Modicisalibacter muralis]|uniref:DNA-binding transcriptional regulator, LysR family n=1 Tax=Modicisalibacter muralis TaxID=119000 RepID=A0A1G9JKB1_9GAMM|nr:LysR family transcriptional regulator [Halomonas muralis]SDL38060.1 DNA-binding transcriptional regulator, LysR family [Halomonas muralis]